MGQLFSWFKIFLSHIPKTLYNILFSLYYKIFYRNIEIGYDYKGLIFNKSHFNKLILFIHGRGGSASCFKMMSTKMLEKKEFKDWNMVAIQSQKTSLADQEKFVSSWIEKSGYDEIVIVGLSKGGLLGINLALNHESIKKVITICSPLHGTIAANYFLSKKNKEYNDLKYCSALHDDLEREISNKDVEIFHFIPRKDYFIYPNSSSFYEKTSPLKIFEVNSDHIGLPFNEKVCEKVSEWIQ